MSSTRKLRVGVLMGGRSGEHEVSLLSAASVLRAIDRRKYEVVPIGITREGRWLLSSAPLKQLKEAAGGGETSITSLVADPTQHALLAVKSSPEEVTERLDLIFPVLHGTFGEDGTIQGLLEIAGVPYVGAGVLSSALGMDKAMMKIAFRARHLPVVDAVEVRRYEWERDPECTVRQVEESFGYPCFVKPANLGSSIGITKVSCRQDLRPAIELAMQYDRKILIEDAAENCREIECAILGNDEPEASVVGEILPGREFYDYEAKYSDSGTKAVIPADLPAPVAEEIRCLAIEAFKAIDGSGMARVDFFVGRDDYRIIVNEINTIPGFTQYSMYPKLWEASGVGYSELIDRLIELALQRHAERSSLRTDYTRQ